MILSCVVCASRRLLLALVLLGVLFDGSEAIAASGRCQPGYVVGSFSCVPLNLCPDGRVLISGTCESGSNRTGEPPAPRPVSSPGPSSVPPTPTPPAIQITPICTSRLQAKRSGKPPRVLLIGGDAWALLRAYISDRRSLDKPVDWAELEVAIFDQKGKKEMYKWNDNVVLSLNDAARGDMQPKAWERALIGRKAAVIARPQSVADSLQFDLYCENSSLLGGQ